MPSDRQVLVSFLRSIDADDVIALPPSRGRATQSAGHEDALEAAAERGLTTPSWVFWHQQSERAFDDRGELVGDLYLHWGGDHARVARALTGCPGPFEVVDNGPQGAFVIRRAVARTDDVGEEAEVKRRLGQIHAELDADPDAAQRWLVAVVRSPLRGVHLQALHALGEAAPRDALEAFAAELKDNVAAGGKRDELSVILELAAVLGRLTGSPAYEPMREQLRKERKHVFRAVLVLLVGQEPWTPENDGFLRKQLGEPKLRFNAARGLVRSLAARDDMTEEALALRLAEDPTLSDVARGELLELACAKRGHRLRGYLALAEDPGVPLLLRARAAARACDYLRFRKDATAVVRIDALVAPGIPVHAPALAAAR